MFRALLNPYLLGGAGTAVLLGVGITEYSKQQTEATGFHSKDPDPNLRKVEKDVIIAKYMRERARLVSCKDEVEGFNACCRQYKPKTWKSFMTFYTCKAECSKMMDCMNERFLSEEFYEECKELYLRDKAIFNESKVIKKTRDRLKEYVKTDTDPECEMSEAASKYYTSVKQYFLKNGDLNAYDDHLLHNRVATL